METKIPPGSIVQRVIILNDKHSGRLYGVQLFDEAGVLLLNAGLTKPAFGYVEKREIILAENERLVGATSVMPRPT